MRVEGIFFVFIFAFLVVADIVYWITSHDPTGTTCIALAAGLGALCGFYLLVTGNRFGPRPEDLPTAEIEDGAGVLGHFSPGSWWPVAIGLSATMVFLGFVVGLWLTFIAAAGLLSALCGLLFEHFREYEGRPAADQLQ